MLLAGILGGSGGLGCGISNGCRESRGGIHFIYLIFFVDPSGCGWHKQIKAGCNNHANNQRKGTLTMFDVIPNEDIRGSFTVEHNDPSNIDLFVNRGSVRRVPIDAITEEAYDDYSLCKAERMPDYSALQNTATGAILNTRPIGKTYNLVPHDLLFSRQAELLANTDLPISNVKVVDRVYDDGLRAHRTIHFNDLQTTVGDSSDSVNCRMDVFNSVDMSWAFQVFSGAYRDLCRNTLVFGGEKAYHQKAKHTKNLSPEALISKAGGSLEMWTGQRDQMNLWAGAKLSDEQFGEILANSICHKNTRAAEAGQTKPINERLMNNILYLFDKEKRELGQTMWAAYNALTHWSTHTQEGWTDLTTGKDYQSGKSTQNVANVQRTRNDMVRTVLASPSWTWAESVAA